ncbi:MAG: hypothetical protein A3F41_02190 [Coxiella sp. RIFCSPHIGHO2_12_FULL_44_14]|nr:MAG: hypothetical protein A3F41_02190 [Coxiella sp. RIFCSPHIGHO2_12_FULL_44_14]
MLAPRINKRVINQSINTHFITAVLGPRRVGKSTLIEEFQNDHPDYTWVTINLDELALRELVSQRGVQNIIEERCGRKIGTYPKMWVAIDEAQKCPLIFEQIKIIYDQSKDKNCIKFILTGSGMLELHQLSAESLAGRIQLNYLTEFTLRETMGLNPPFPVSDLSILDLIFDQQWDAVGSTIDALSPLRHRALLALDEQLIWGGLPEVLLLPDEKKRLTYIVDYLQTYLEKDVRAIATITDLSLYKNLLEISAELTGSVRNDQKIIEALHCSRDALKKYRGFLTATLMYQEIYPPITSTLKRLVKSPKGYLLNNGLISYLTGINTLSVLIKSGQIGHRLENWFLKELNCAIARTPIYSKIHYWRTTAGAEIDFIVQRNPYLFPFEITYSQSIDRKKLRNLHAFLASEPKAPAGIYIYRGDYQYDKQRRIHFIPAWVIA